MKELNFGDTIEVDDRVNINGKFYSIFKVDDKNAYFRLNKKTIVQLPRVYSIFFTVPDELDENSYTLYRSDLDCSISIPTFMPVTNF